MYGLSDFFYFKSTGDVLYVKMVPTFIFIIICDVNPDQELRW
jgi:hypothetical protein